FRPGGFLTQLGGTLGVRLEDFSALVRPESDDPGERFAPFGPFAGGTATGTLFAEEIEAVDAEVVARFPSGRAAGRPAMTRRFAGRGSAWYLATVPDEPGTQQIVDGLLAAAGVGPVLPGLPAAVEVTRRGDLVTVINHGATAVAVALTGTDIVTGEPVAGVHLDPDGYRFVLTDGRAATD
ncbi:MAG: beta-galactosidase trimerization domain-containing protein, partial [Propionicimonas sp.]|nr:beta-galactosidase trimerization domain-containing protein [Propionicimonas sp.]